jgi:hypothetical protein
MKDKNSIVRTKTTYGSLDKPEEMYSEIEFMTFNKYVSKLNPAYIYKDEPIFKLYPYNFYEKPYYWLIFDVLKKETKQTNHPKTKEKQQSAIISFIVKFWWQILIPLLIGLVLIAVEKKWFI